MKVFILTQDLSSAGQVWMNVFWPHYNAISECVPTEVLVTPNSVGEVPWHRRLRRFFKTARDKQSASAALSANALTRQKDEKYDEKAVHKTIETVKAKRDPNGPNILHVWALRHADIERAERLLPIWDSFDYKVLSIVDNINVPHVVSKIDGRFDLITSFCGDIADELRAATAIPTLYFPPHTDVMNFAVPDAYRPVDFFVVGRREPEIHAPLHQYYNRPGSERIAIDYVSRSVNFSYSRETEFQLLMSAYGRAKMAFCFEASAIDRFKNRSPLTERWVHAWAAGCSVIGSRPTGANVEEATDWTDATIDLPTDPDAARALTEQLLNDEQALARRRLRNVEYAFRKHDTRLRLATLLDTLDLPKPDALTAALAQLGSRADALARERDAL